MKGIPIPFYKMEEEISLKYLEEIHFEKGAEDKDRIAVIGGGPAGITIALLLQRKGYKVTIFESRNQIGGVLRYGIPEYRLPKYIIDLLEKHLLDLGVKIRPNILIGPVLSLDKLFEDGYIAAFIGTGVWNPRTLGIKGESFGNVHFAIDYLKSPEHYSLGENVAIIGAGNVAMDAARTAKRNGSRATIIYRKGMENMTASKKEIAEAEEDGVEFLLYHAPVEITDEGIILKKQEEGQPEEEVSFKADSIIVAISQNPRANIVSNTTDLETNNAGLLLTDEKGNTTKEGTFASGDVVTGARTVVEAVHQAKIVAEEIEAYCRAKKAKG